MQVYELYKDGVKQGKFTVVGQGNDDSTVRVRSVDTGRLAIATLDELVFAYDDEERERDEDDEERRYEKFSAVEEDEDDHSPISNHSEPVFSKEQIEDAVSHHKPAIVTGIAVIAVAIVLALVALNGTSVKSSEVAEATARLNRLNEEDVPLLEERKELKSEIAALETRVKATEEKLRSNSKAKKEALDKIASFRK